MRRASRFMASNASESAVKTYIDMITIAEELLLQVEGADRVSLKKKVLQAQLEQATVLFSVKRWHDALVVLDQLLQDEEWLSDDLGAHVLVWTAKCKREENANRRNEIASLLWRAGGRSLSEDVQQEVLSELLVVLGTPTAHAGVMDRVVELCRCPMSFDTMNGPVITPSGISYERTMIERHLETRHLRQLVELMRPMIEAAEQDDQRVAH